MNALGEASVLRVQAHHADRKEQGLPNAPNLDDEAVMKAAGQRAKQMEDKPAQSTAVASEETILQAELQQLNEAIEEELLKKAMAPREQMPTRFEGIDLNGDGVIDRGEFQKLQESRRAPSADVLPTQEWGFTVNDAHDATQSSEEYEAIAPQPQASLQTEEETRQRDEERRGQQTPEREWLSIELTREEFRERLLAAKLVEDRIDKETAVQRKKLEAAQEAAREAEAKARDERHRLQATAGQQAKEMQDRIMADAESRIAQASMREESLQKDAAMLRRELQDAQREAREAQAKARQEIHGKIADATMKAADMEAQISTQVEHRVRSDRQMRIQEAAARLGSYEAAQHRAQETTSTAKKETDVSAEVQLYYPGDAGGRYRDTLHGIICLYRAHKGTLVESTTTLRWATVCWEHRQLTLALRQWRVKKRPKGCRTCVDRQRELLDWMADYRDLEIEVKLSRAMNDELKSEIHELNGLSQESADELESIGRTLIIERRHSDALMGGLKDEVKKGNALTNQLRGTIAELEERLQSAEKGRDRLLAEYSTEPPNHMPALDRDRRRPPVKTIADLPKEAAVIVAPASIKSLPQLLPNENETRRASSPAHRRSLTGDPGYVPLLDRCFDMYHHTESNAASNTGAQEATPIDSVAPLRREFRGQSFEVTDRAGNPRHVKVSAKPLLERCLDVYREDIFPALCTDNSKNNPPERPVSNPDKTMQCRSMPPPPATSTPSSPLLRSKPYVPADLNRVMDLPVAIDGHLVVSTASSDTTEKDASIDTISFDDIDTNHDGVIDRAEFEAARGRKARGPKQFQGEPYGEGLRPGAIELRQARRLKGTLAPEANTLKTSAASPEHRAQSPIQGVKQDLQREMEEFARATSPRSPSQEKTPERRGSEEFDEETKQILRKRGDRGTHSRSRPRKKSPWRHPDRDMDLQDVKGLIQNLPDDYFDGRIGQSTRDRSVSPRPEARLTSQDGFPDAPARRVTSRRVSDVNRTLGNLPDTYFDKPPTIGDAIEQARSHKLRRIESVLSNELKSAASFSKFQARAIEAQNTSAVFG